MASACPFTGQRSSRASVTWAMKGRGPDVADLSLRPTVERERLAARARLLAWAGNAWHLIEFAVAVGAGAAASSTALIGFGMDSLIEVLASSVIIWRFGGRRRESAAAERRAQQLVAVSFFVLAGYVLVDTLWTVAGGRHPQVSWPGIALAAFTAVTMPLLAIAKRRVGRRLASAATVSEGSQNMLCAYLSVGLGPVQFQPAEFSKLAIVMPNQFPVATR